MQKKTTKTVAIGIGGAKPATATTAMTRQAKSPQRSLSKAFNAISKVISSKKQSVSAVAVAATGAGGYVADD